MQRAERTNRVVASVIFIMWGIRTDTSVPNAL